TRSSHAGGLGLIVRSRGWRNVGLRRKRKEEGGCKAKSQVQIDGWDHRQDSKNGRTRRLKKRETGSGSHPLESVAKQVLPPAIRGLRFYSGGLADLWLDSRT